MLMVSHPGITEILFLRDVIIPFVKEREKQGFVDLDYVNHACGSPSCLNGWAFAKFNKQYGSMLLNGQLAPGDWASLFGPKFNGTLDDRALACDKIIERMLSEVMV